MRSMYRFSIIALAVGALALLAAGTAFAEVSIKGGITADLEIVSSDPGGGGAKSNQLGVQTEAVFDFSAASGPVSMKVRLEVNDDGGKTSTASPTAPDTVRAGAILDNMRNEVAWKVTDAFTMTISGSSFGESAGSTPFGATTVGHFTQNGSVAGHQAGVTEWVFGVNRPSADFQFAFGGGNAGLVLQPQYALGGSSSPTETKTITPYYNGKFGNLGVHVYLANASGKEAAGNPAANEASVAVIFATSAMKVALQIAPGKKKTSAGAETKTQALNLGGSFGAIKFHYTSETETPSAGGAKTEDLADIAVSFSSPIGEGSEWTVGVANNNNKVTEAKKTVLAWGVSLKY